MVRREVHAALQRTYTVHTGTANKCISIKRRKTPCRTPIGIINSNSPSISASKSRLPHHLLVSYAMRPPCSLPQRNLAARSLSLVEESLTAAEEKEDLELCQRMCSARPNVVPKTRNIHRIPRPRQTLQPLLPCHLSGPQSNPSWRGCHWRTCCQ